MKDSTAIQLLEQQNADLRAQLTASQERAVKTEQLRKELHGQLERSTKAFDETMGERDTLTQRLARVEEVLRYYAGTAIGARAVEALTPPAKLTEAPGIERGRICQMATNMTDALTRKQELRKACEHFLDANPMSIPITEEPECVDALVAFVTAQLAASEARYQGLLKKWGEGYTVQVEARIKELEVELEECKHQNGISAREMQLEGRVTALEEEVAKASRIIIGLVPLAKIKAADLEWARNALAQAQGKDCQHEWGIDGMHSNEFCKKCFVSKVSP